MSGALRVSDAEREEVVERLRLHAAEGRLDVQELEQRLEAAFGAKSREDLAELEGDLPAARPRRRDRQDFREHLNVYLAVNAGLIVIWALTGMGYFWPVWPMMGWGIGVLAHAFDGKGGRCTGRSSRGRSARASSA